MTPPKMMTVADAARESGLSQYAVRQLLREGRVHGVRVGRGKLLVNFDDLCRYLNETFVGGDEDDRSR
jgi:excisionase family DNA binding protein